MKTTILILAAVPLLAADWHDDRSLMKATLATSPASFKSHKLAAGLYDSDPGRFTIDQVLAEAEKSLAILDPLPDRLNNADSYLRSGGYYLTKGDQLAARGADGTRVASPGSLQAYQRSLALLRRARSIMEASREAEAARRVRSETAPGQDNGMMAGLKRTTSMVELRLGNVGQALEEAGAALALAPAAPESYRQLAAAYLAAGRDDEAAVALLEGTLVTSDQGLRQELVELYRRGLDTQGCATRPGPYGPAMDPSCGIVHRHMCTAATRAVELYRRMNRGDLMEKTRLTAASLGCP